MARKRGVSGDRPAPAARSERGPREKVNLRFLACLIVASGLLAGVWYGVNRWQVRRHAADLLRQVDVAEEQKRPGRAARFLGLYVGLVPGDTEARARYGLLLESLADSPRGLEGALGVFEQVLIRDPSRQDIRRRAARLAVKLGRYDDAVEYLKVLSGELPKDGEIQELFGQAHEGRGEYGRAAKRYQEAMAAAPERVEPYLRLARLLRSRLARPDEAEATLDKLIKANGQSYEAFLGRAQYRLEGTPDADTLQAARRDMEQALRLAPDEPEVLLRAAALIARLPNGLEEARGHLRRLLERHPQNVQGYQLLARVELLAARPEEAIQALRRGLEKIPELPELLWNLANLLIQRGNLDEVEELLGRLAKLDLPRPRLEYLRAALMLRRGDWAAARRGLEAVRPLLTDSRELTIQCDLLLAECCERAGERETEVLICRRALALDGQQAGVRLRLVLALQRLGRLEEALDQCQRMMALTSPPPAGWSVLAQLLIRQNLRLPEKQQQWQEIDRVLARAAEATPDAVEVTLLKAETLLARKDAPGAHEELKRARQKQPRKEDLWMASVDLAIRDNKPEMARGIVADAEKQLGDGAGLRLIRLRLLLGTADAEKGLRELESGLEKLSDEDQGRVLAALAETHFQAGRKEEARRLWAAVARVRPDDLEPRLRSFDLALQGEDEGGVNEALADVRRVEGEGGTLGHYNEARRLIWRASHGDKSGLATARSELALVSKRRPGWSRVSLGMGQTWDLEGREERALEYYLRAVELGERSPDLIRRTVRLLYDRSRYAEAELVIQRLPEQTLVLADMQRLMAAVSLENGNYNQALEAARRAIQADSRDYRDYVWLGQILWVAAQRAEVRLEQRRAAEGEAEKALYHAVELAPTEPEGWVALVQHLARTRQTENADEVLKQAQAQLPAEQAPLALAQCYVALGKPDKARELFAAALKARPDDAVVLRTAAEFYLQANDLQAAERSLKKLIESDKRDRGAASWARSLLAVVLAAEGGDERASEALKLVGKPDDSGRDGESVVETVQRERARAVVLAMRPERESQREAIDILEQINTRQPLSSEDRFLLVQLYDRIGNAAKARERMLPLLKSGSARYLAYHINALLLQGQAVEAEAWLADLEKMEPSSLPTAFLKAKLLKAQGRGSEAAPLLKDKAKGQDAPTVRRIAALLEDVGCGADAIVFYRQYAEQAKKPEAILPLAGCLARQNRLGEALDLCDRAWQTCPPLVAAEASVNLLQMSRPESKDLDRVERRLKEALDKDRGSAQLLLCRGSLQEVRGRYQDAENIYRQVLARDPRNAVALNNLAWILALRDGKGDEALLGVNRAIEVLGPIPELLDTRAVAALAAGRTKQALTDLQDALARPNLEPKVRFSIVIHLAQAHQRAGDIAKAKKSWKEAHAGEIRVEALHGLERAGYDRLSRELGRP